MGRAQKLKEQRRLERMARKSRLRRVIRGRFNLYGVLSTLVGIGLLVGLVAGYRYLIEKSEKRSVVTETETTNPTSCPAAAKSNKSYKEPPQMIIDVSKKYTACMSTSKGDIKIELFPAKAPKTVNNFVVLSKDGFYHGLTFHRIIKDFVIQGGDPNGDGSGGPGYTFADELPKAGEYKLGSVAMANSGPDTNGSQFFIIIGQQGVGLPPKYSLFGQVIEGLDIAQEIAKVETDEGDKPKEPVVIKSIGIIEE